MLAQVLLLAAGACIGAVMCAGAILLVGMVAAFAYLLPWIEVPVCRARFVVSAAAMLAGAVAFVLIRRSPAQAPYFMIAAWLLYIPSMCMHLVLLVSLDRGYRVGGSRIENPEFSRCPKSNMSVH